MLCPSAPAAEKIGEGDVKAAFVLNFIKFVEWPASAFHSPEDPIVLSVLGNDSTAASLVSLDGKKVSGRRVVVRKVPGLSALERCHVLFANASEKAALASYVSSKATTGDLPLAGGEQGERRSPPGDGQDVRGGPGAGGR